MLLKVLTFLLKYYYKYKYIADFDELFFQFTPYDLIM